MILSNNKRIRKGRLLTCLRRQAGFTLVELLITITIFVILTGVVLFNQNGFNNTILLKNLAYDIALTIKQAQTYGVNVRESQKANEFSSSYGIYFNIGTDGNKKSIILFSDTSGDKKYSGGMGCNVNLESDAECVQKYSLKNNSYISKLCVGTSDADCNEHSDINDLTIYFKRPDPDAEFLVGGVYSDSSYAKITVSSATNSASSSIIVTSPGQIYIKK